jgi:phage shock protein C
MNGMLYRSRDDAMIGGVCGGLANYLRISSVYVRVFFVLLTLANGIGALIYFLLWMIVPLEGVSKSSTLQDTVRQGSKEIAERTLAVGQDLRNMVARPTSQISVIVGSVFVIVGVFYFFDNLSAPWLRWLDVDLLWPLLLIFGGLALLLRRDKGESDE